MDEINQSEQQKFLSELDAPREDILNAPFTEGEPEVKEEETDETLKEEDGLRGNRRTLRLARRAQDYKEEAIAINARLQAITESRQTEPSEAPDYLKRVKAIFGDATPEAREASGILEEALAGSSKAAEERALERLRAEQAKESEAVAQEGKTLDGILEQVEDEFNADFSNEAERKGFLELLEKVSPKDRDGNIIEFADPSSTYELYEARKDRTNSRAKELADRSMTRSGASQPSRLQVDAVEKYLKENDII